MLSWGSLNLKGQDFPETYTNWKIIPTQVKSTEDLLQLKWEQVKDEIGSTLSTAHLSFGPPAACLLLGVGVSGLPTLLVCVPSEPGCTGSHVATACPVVQHALGYAHLKTIFRGFILNICMFLRWTQLFRR